MAHFAEIKDGIVVRVLVVNKDYLDTGVLGDPANWVQTSYNTSKGEYTRGSDMSEKLSLKNAGSEADKAARNRKNYAGVGYTYDKVLDVFIPPQPYKSWVLNEETYTWEPPMPYPDDGKAYEWDEDNVTWIESKFQPNGNS